jgi:hypothetical protein
VVLIRALGGGWEAQERVMGVMGEAVDGTLAVTQTH